MENSIPVKREWSLKQEVLLLGFMVGVIAERSLWLGIAGPGLVLTVGALAFASVWIASRTGLSWRKTVVSWSALAVVASVATLFRASVALQLTFMLMILLTGSMLLMRIWGARPGRSFMLDHIFAFALLPFKALAGISLLSQLRIPLGGASKWGMALVRGFLLAAPLVLILGVLFASADAAFGRLVDDVGTVFSPDLIRHLFLTLAFGCAAAGLLLALTQTEQANPLRELEFPKFGATETLIVMGSLVGLFVCFVMLQLSYLFGGRETIEAVSGLSLAEYARRGFFELLATAMLSLAVLLVGNAVSLSQSWFRLLAGLLIGCVLVILVSAVQRLWLYIDEFGLSLDRFNALAVMAWVAVMLLWFAVTTLRGRTERFPGGALFSGIAIAFAMLLVNPPALVARVNIERSIQRDVELDNYHLLGLGADAVPVLLDSLQDISAGSRCFLANALILRWGPASQEARKGAEAGWRGWNLARARAIREVAARQSELEAQSAGCAIR